jgi:hypothetical protein
MLSKTFQLTTALMPGEALGRVAQLLDAESVGFAVESARLHSVNVPLPLSNWDRRQYSRRNWVGVNPFVAFSGVAVHCVPEHEGSTSVTCVLDRGRTLMKVCIEAVLVGGVAANLPTIGVVILMAAFLCLAIYQWSFSYLLVRSEIDHVLR